MRDLTPVDLVVDRTSDEPTFSLSQQHLENFVELLDCNDGMQLMLRLLDVFDDQAIS